MSGHVLGVGFSTGLGDSSAIGALFHEHVLAVQPLVGNGGGQGLHRGGVQQTVVGGTSVVAGGGGGGGGTERRPQ